MVALGRAGDTEATVAFLAELAGPGPALELATGTGRVALPLAARGIELPSQEAQVRCFANVARHLAADGAFVVEAFVPDPTRFTHGQKTHTTLVETDRVVLETSQHDPVAQRVKSAHVVLTRNGVRIDPVHVRYAWPSELDLMGRLAGLRFRDRFAGWHREPFTAGSARHVSVYERG